MRKLCFGLIAAFTFLGARAASATSQTYLLHGASCFSITSGIAPQVTQYGVNAISTAIDVVCPVVVPSQNYTRMDVELVGYNRNSSDHLSCAINATDTQGNNFVAAVAPLPSNMATFQVNTASISTPLATMPFVTCHLPAQTGSGFSHLTSVFVTLTF